MVWHHIGPNRMLPGLVCKFCTFLEQMVRIVYYTVHALGLVPALPSIGMVLSLYLDERRGLQGNTSMRSREFRRAQPEGTLEIERCSPYLFI